MKINLQEGEYRVLIGRNTFRTYIACDEPTEEEKNDTVWNRTPKFKNGQYVLIDAPAVYGFHGVAGHIESVLISTRMNRAHAYWVWVNDICKEMLISEDALSPKPPKGTVLVG